MIKAVRQQPSEIAAIIRQKICSDTCFGDQFPFSYINNQLQLSDLNIFVELQRNDPKRFTLCVGNDICACQKAIISSKLCKDTSQGKIYIVLISDVLVILKVDTIHDKKLWIHSAQKKYTFCSDQAPAIIIDEAFADAYCSAFLSSIVEKGITPHFPLCYSTNVVSATSKKTGSGKQSQLIWIEYLPKGIRSVFKKTQTSWKWKAYLFQIFAGLNAASKFGFIHNDLHCANIRYRRVPVDTMITYYNESDSTFYRIPTFGVVCVIIDFGRSSINFENQKLVSSVFSNRGACAGFDPSKNIDVIRLLSSLYSTLNIIEKENERDEMQKFFKECTMLDNKRSLIDIMENDSIDLSLCLEEIPRKYCIDTLDHRFVLRKLCAEFLCNTINSNDIYKLQF